MIGNLIAFSDKLQKMIAYCANCKNICNVDGCPIGSPIYNIGETRKNIYDDDEIAKHSLEMETIMEKKEAGEEIEKTPFDVVLGMSEYVTKLMMENIPTTPSYQEPSPKDREKDLIPETNLPDWIIGL